MRLARSVLPIAWGILALGFVYELWRHLPAAGDFWTFWAAARALAAGRDPYVFASLTGVAALPPGPTPGPFLSPLSLAEAIRPLALLPLGVAQHLWLLVNLMLSGVLLLLLLGLAGSRLRWPAVIGGAALLMAFQPFDITLWLGQTDVLVVVALAVGWRLLQRGRPFLGGLVMSAVVVDVHLILGFGCFLLYSALVHRRWRPLAGLGTGLAVTAAACLLHPADLAQWLFVTLPHAQRAAIEPWDTLSVLQATSELLGRRAGLVLTLAVDIVAVALAYVAWGRCRSEDAGTGELAVAAVLTLVTTTFAYNQDFLVAVLAAPLLVRLWHRSARGAWLGALAFCLGVGYGLAELTNGHITPGHAAFILGAPMLALLVLVFLPKVAPRLEAGHWAWSTAWVLLTVGGYAILTYAHSEIGAEVLMLGGALAFVAALAAFGPGGPRAWPAAPSTGPDPTAREFGGPAAEGTPVGG